MCEQECAGWRAVTQRTSYSTEFFERFPLCYRVSKPARSVPNSECHTVVLYRNTPSRQILYAKTGVSPGCTKQNFCTSPTPVLECHSIRAVIRLIKNMRMHAGCSRIETSSANSKLVYVRPHIHPSVTPCRVCFTGCTTAIYQRTQKYQPS